jgi:uncharacterized membrane protein
LSWPASRTFPPSTRASSVPSLFSHPLFQAALWFAAIFLLLALAVTILRKWRGGAADDQLDDSEMLTKFRELHLQGGLSDDEYRTIKTKLATKPSAELNDSKETG